MDPPAVLVRAFSLDRPKLVCHCQVVNISNAQVRELVSIEKGYGRGKERYSALRIVAPVNRVDEDALPAASELFDPHLLGNEREGFAARVDPFEGRDDD